MIVDARTWLHAMPGLALVVACSRPAPEPEGREPAPAPSLAQELPSAAPAAPAVATASLTQSEVARIASRLGQAGGARVPIQAVPAPASVEVPPPEATRGPPGTAFQLLARGTKRKRKPTDAIRLRFTVWGREGTVARSSAFGAEDATVYRPGQVPPQWAPLVDRMDEGDKARLWFVLDEVPGAEPQPLLADFELLQVLPAE